MKLLLSAAALQLVSSHEPTVHPLRAAQIETINETPGVLWRAAPHPRFAASPPGASSGLMGVLGHSSAVLSLAVSTGTVVDISRDLGDGEIPLSFDSAERWPHCARIISDIRDQSNCGCCWAFAGAEAASDRMCIATDGALDLPLSAQDVCFNGGGLTSFGCSGGQITAPWKYIQKKEAKIWRNAGGGAVSGGQYAGTGPFGSGFCVEFSMPHCHHHGPQGDDPYPAEGEPGCESQTTPAGPTECDAAAVAPNDDFAADRHSFEGDIVTARGEEAMQRAIMVGGPMEVAFTVYEDFEDYDGGIYHHVSGRKAGGHAVKMVGWGEEDGNKFWKVANSWNPNWGEAGYFRILRGVNEGGIENGAVASSHDATWSRAGDAVEADGATKWYGLQGSVQ